MTRPVPLFSEPTLLNILDPHALTDEWGIHGDYLSENLSGEVFIIARDPERLERLGEFAADVDAVDAVETQLNDTGVSQQIANHDLGIREGRTFDTVVYTKEVTSWFGRSKDFQRLTPHLAQGGTMLAKSKWAPDSNRVRLEEIAVAGAFSFAFPEVYLRFTKVNTQKTLQAAVADGGTTTERATSSSSGSAGFAGRGLADQTKSFRSQFPEDARATEFSPGWSWHSRLTEHVEEAVADLDGEVANLCCGSSKLGDVRVDKLESWEDADGETHQTGATHQEDATDLPFEDDRFAAVVTDPPWKVDPETRVRLFSEAVRVTKPGGVVIG